MLRGSLLRGGAGGARRTQRVKLESAQQSLLSGLQGLIASFDAAVNADSEVPSSSPQPMPAKRKQKSDNSVVGALKCIVDRAPKNEWKSLLGKLRNVVKLASEGKLSLDCPAPSMAEDAAAHSSPSNPNSSLSAPVAGRQTFYKALPKTKRPSFAEVAAGQKASPKPSHQKPLSAPKVAIGGLGWCYGLPGIVS